MKKLSFLAIVLSLFLFGCKEEENLFGGEQVEAQIEFEEPEVVGIGQIVQVGDTVAKVNYVEEKTLIKDGILNFVPESSNDNFIIVDITIGNSGSRDIIVNSMFFNVIADGVKIKPSSLTITDGTYFSYTKVEPNSSQRGKILFEVPKDALDLTLQIDDMNFSEEKGFVVIK